MNVSFLLNLLFLLITVCVVIWAARAIMAAFGIGDPIATLVYVAIVIIVLLAVLQSGLLRSGLRVT
jgi:uncharacterized membrane protein YcjF (UPF0283 family)